MTEQEAVTEILNPLYHETVYETYRAGFNPASGRAHCRCGIVGEWREPWTIITQREAAQELDDRHRSGPLAPEVA